MCAEHAERPLRVLCLEDNPHDAELVREHLLAGGFDVSMDIASTGEEFRRLLTASKYDVILADYTLPDFDAPSALDAAKAAGVTVPFICVTGTVDETRAVELLERGGTDYVLKDRMGRLVFAVRRAMNAASEQTAHRESEERFQQLFVNMPDAVIVHDRTVILANPAAHKGFGYAADADMVGIALVDLIHPDELQRAVDLLDRLEGGEEPSGPLEFRSLRVDGTIWYTEVTTSRLTLDGRVVFESILRDLTEHRLREREMTEYRDQLELLLAERGERLRVARSALASVTAVISRTVEIRDPYTAGHQRRVAALAVAIAERLGMPTDDVEEIAVAAAIHDIGKVSIPAEVLSKPAALSPVEFELVKTHSQAGFEIISSAHLAGAVPEIVLQHHERCDGSGYPRGLSADQLLLSSKVIMVADVVEAMSSHRPYRSALGVDAARTEITAGSGVKFDEVVVAACLDVLDDGFAFEDVQV